MRSEIVVIENPKSPDAEMFRNLRTNIQFMNADSDKKVILITSTTPNEGKSYITANLASSFAQIDKKVLIIDADMRKGRQFSLFNLNPRPGLSNYLSGVVDKSFSENKDNINNFIQETNIDNLYVLVAGSVPPNPSELLVTRKMNSIIDDLKKQFDVIIFDTPPCLVVADALMLTRLVDFSILVAAQYITKMEDLVKAKTSIENVGGKVAGVVLNKVQITAKKYENTYYYNDKINSFKNK